MGKGSNVQKAQAARERNAKKAGKSPEELKAASDKARKDAEAKKCQICLQTFMVNAPNTTLYQHITAKHPDVTDLTACFTELAGFDPKYVPVVVLVVACSCLLPLVILNRKREI
jgi:hypothetical protein